MAAPYGLDTPAGSGHGYAPYEEAAAKSRSRANAYRIALAAIGGISVPRGANFGEAFLSSLAGSARGLGAAQQAAEQYAAKKMQAQQDEVFRQLRMQDLQGQIDARNKAMSAPPKPERPEKPFDWQRTPEEQAAIIDFETRKAKSLASAKPTSGGSSGQMSEEALNQAADLYATTGQLSGFGFGASPDRAAVRNRAAMRHPGTDIASNRAEYQKNQKTITTTQNLRDLSGAWENTVIANGQVMMEAYKGIPEAQNMPLNYVLRHGAAIAGSPAMAAFNTARETFKNEVARLLNQPGGSGGQVLSDSARREVERIVSGNLTGRQLQASFEIIRKDAANKRVGYDRQIEQIRSRIKTRFGVSPDLNMNQQPEEQGVLIWNPETGNLEPAQ